MEMGRRPTSSEPGPQKDGPTAKPMRKRVSMRSPTSRLAWNSCVMAEMEEDGAEEANVLYRGKAYQSNQAGLTAGAEGKRTRQRS